MSFQSFSRSNLRRILRASDFYQSAEVRSADDFDPAIERAQREISERSLSFDDIVVFRKHDKPIFQLQQLHQKLIVRKLADTLSRVYKTKPANRIKICNTIKTALSDSTAYQLIKCDISAFFESVPQAELKQKILSDSIFSVETKWVFRRLFECPALYDASGLPRALPISTVLSEKFLERFDDRIRRREDVFYYARFVDDIIAFVSGDASGALQYMKQQLQENGLTVNQRKTKIYSNFQDAYAERNICGERKPDFNYLGYRFRKSSPKSSVKVSIANSKIKKIKTRLVSSILTYSNDLDFALLEDRIRFLSGNYFVANSSSDSPLKAGIFYNYSIANSVHKQLTHLDEFYKKQVLAPINLFKRRGAALSEERKRRLLRFSFRAGFDERKLRSFSAARISKIKGAWGND